VREGQLLVVLDARDLETSVARAEAGREEMKNAVLEADAAVALSRSQLDLAQVTFHRMQDLWNKRSIANQEYDEASARLKATGAPRSALVDSSANKGKDQSPVDSINGTTGVAAGVDSLLVLEEKNGNKLMHIKSRETEDASLALRFDLDTGGWTVAGDAEEVIQSGARKDILRILNDANTPMYPVAIAKALSKNANTVRGLLMRLRNDAVIQTLPDGAQWFANRAVPPDYTSKPVSASPVTSKPPDPDDIPIFA